MPQHRRFTSILAAMAMIGFLTNPAAAQGNILDQIPAGSQVAVVVPKLTSLSAKLKMINEKLGLQIPQLQDVLLSAKANLGLVKGIDDNGGLIMAATSLPIPPLPQPGVQPDPPPQPGFVILVPVTNYSVFLGNFGSNVVQQGGLASVNFMGQPWFLSKSGKHAVLGMRKQDVTGYQPAGAALMKRLGLHGQRAVASSDVIFLADIQVLSKTLQPMVAQGIAQMKQMFKQQQQANPNPNLDLAIAYMDLYARMFDAYLRDGDMLLGSVSIGDAGVEMNYVNRFKAGSVIAKMFDRPPAKVPSFARLPGIKPYVMAMTADTSSFPLVEWYEEMATMFKGNKELGDLFNKQVDLVRNMTGQWEIGMYPGPDVFNMVSIAGSKDPAQYMAKFRETLTSMNTIKIAEGVSYKTTYKPKALQVGAVWADHYAIKMQLPPELQNQAAAGPLAKMMDMYNGYIFAGKDTVGMTMGGGPAMVKAATGAGSGIGLLDKDPAIIAARKHLPAHRMLEAHLDMSGMMTWVENITRQFGAAMKFPIRKDLPPFSGAMAASGGTIEAKGYFPYETIMGVKDMIQILQAQGGPQPKPELIQ
jgi:hypothetical protein